MLGQPREMLRATLLCLGDKPTVVAANETDARFHVARIGEDALLQRGAVVLRGTASLGELSR